MSRKISAVLLSAVLVLFSAFPVLAEGENNVIVSVISAYYTDGMFYTYVDAETEADLERYETGLRVNNVTTQGEGSLQTLKESDLAVRYMLLLDLSTSMPKYQKQICSFADALLKSETQEYQVTVGGFGEKFEILAEDLDNCEDVQKVIEETSCDHRATDICGGVSAALKYLSGKCKSGNGPVNLIVLTDGIPYLAGNYESEEKGILETSQNAAQMISQTPEVILHTVGVNSWDPTVLDALSSGKGLDFTVTTIQAAKRAGKNIAAFTDDLYVTQIPFTWNYTEDRLSMQLLLQVPDSMDMYFADMENAGNADRIPEVDPSDTSQIVILDPEGGSEDGDAETAPEESQPIEGSAIDETEEGTGEDGSEEEGSAEQGSETSEISETSEVTETSGTSEIPETSGIVSEGVVEDASQNAEGNTSTGISWQIIAAIAGGLVLLVIIVVIVMMRLRGKKAYKGDGSGVLMQLEVISGNCRNKKNTIYLRDELIIGRSSSCDIIFEDEDVALKNLRIYTDNQMIYLENLSAGSTIYLNGMKIFAENRLRSGDEVAIGDVKFLLRF